MDMLTADRLREFLNYDADTGVFTRRVSHRGTARAGSVAGSFNTCGYLQIQIDGRRYLSHRLAWLYTNWRWPAAEIDHINGDRADNRIANLREASRSENCQNLRLAPASSSTGLLGACPYKGKFRAQIALDGKHRHLGIFATAAEAHVAYLEAKRELHSFGTL